MAKEAIQPMMLAPFFPLEDEAIAVGIAIRETVKPLIVRRAAAHPPVKSASNRLTRLLAQVIEDFMGVKIIVRVVRKQERQPSPLRRLEAINRFNCVGYGCCHGDSIGLAIPKDYTSLGVT